MSSVEFEFDIFRPRAAQVRVQMNAVGDFGHQRFRKAHVHAMVVIFDHRAEGESARVRRIVVRAVVVDRPIHELKIGVACRRN